MIVKPRSLVRHTSALLAALVAVPALTVTIPSAYAQATRQNRPNIVQRHPTATGIAAGIGTRALLKRSAAAKKRRGQRLSFAERHPTLTGIGAAIGTRAVVKSTTRRRRSQ